MKNFKEKIILILISFLCFSSDKPYNGPEYVYDDALNSLNFGLIGISDNYLVLNKINDVTAYDFNGNAIKILNTYNRGTYQNIAVRDSLLILSGKTLMFGKISNTGQFLTVPFGYYMEAATANELLLKDSIIFVLCNRLSTSGYNQGRSLIALQMDRKTNVLRRSPKFSYISMDPSSFAVMQDSLLFYLNNKISKVNLNDAVPVERSFDLNFNPENTFTTAVSYDNHLCISNSKSIFFIDYNNNNIQLIGEMK